MAKIERFEDIEAWKRAREVNRMVYRLSSAPVFVRDFALVNQIRRASISIISNIAEGFERNGDREFVQFLLVANASCGEVRAQSYIALDQDYITEIEFTELRDKLEQASRMISGLISYLKQSEMKGTRFRTA